MTVVCSLHCILDYHTMFSILGSELCTVVEAMFSFEVLFSIQGDPIFAERAEKLTYNALPATITSDMWAHQYLQQPNEMNAIHSDDHVWTHDGPDSTLYAHASSINFSPAIATCVQITFLYFPRYGLAPNYVCCTENFNQGWPKFTQHLVMEYGSGLGLVVAMYSPAVVEYTLANGVEAKLLIKTDYPFDDTVSISASCGMGMFLSLRIPSWAVEPTILINNTNVAMPPVPGGWSFMTLLHCTLFYKMHNRYPL